MPRPLPAGARKFQTRAQPFKCQAQACNFQVRTLPGKFRSVLIHKMVVQARPMGCRPDRVTINKSSISIVWRTHIEDETQILMTTYLFSIHPRRHTLTPPWAGHWTLRKSLWWRLLTWRWPWLGRNYYFWSINVVFWCEVEISGQKKICMQLGHQLCSDQRWRHLECSNGQHFI